MKNIKTADAELYRKNYEVKRKLQVCGFPRSGNVFLSYLLREVYYPQLSTSMPYHFEDTFDKFNRLIVPVRNPLEAIASFNNFLLPHSIQDDINLYININTKALNSVNTIFVNFDQFTSDVAYVKNIIKNNFNIEPMADPTIESIKQSIIDGNHEIHLPNPERYEAIESTKLVLSNMPEFQDCVNIYNTLISRC
jgi:hypothetical protein